MNEGFIKATIRLFKAVPVAVAPSRLLFGVHSRGINAKAIIKDTIRMGFVLSPDVLYKAENPAGIVDLIKEIFGLSAENMNNAFHKSWLKVQETPLEHLIVEQLAHYCTTYGKGHEHEYLDEKSLKWGVADLAHKVAQLPDIEMNKIWDDEYIYIPKEALEIPGLTEDFKLVIIKGYTGEELKSKLLKLLNSGIALSETTIGDVIEVINGIDIDDQDLSGIKNKEVRVIVYDKLDKVPANPVEFLRFVIYKTTGKTLLIKNEDLIEQIKTRDSSEVSLRLFNKYKEAYGLERLAEIFYRFKPLFLAFRGGIPVRKMINQIRRLAVKNHKPIGEDYLNTVTALIKKGDFIDLREELNKASIFRKIRLAYALNFRIRQPGSILYRIRNGKAYAADFNFQKSDITEAVLDQVITSIVSDISPGIKGKLIYIPDYIHYALPATEKQFTGYFPSGTYVTVPRDLIFGIHWNNVDNYSIDLDLAIISKNSKFGWDSGYRSADNSILFSGDMTSAPNGAAELFYLARQTKQAIICTVNYYNFSEGIEVPYKVIVASERIKNFGRNYMINPNSVLVTANSKINRQQNILGLIVTNENENRFYFAETSIGRSITSRQSPVMTHVRQYLFDFYENSISLNDIFKRCGARITDKKKAASIDLSPESLEKDTILNLLTPN